MSNDLGIQLVLEFHESFDCYIGTEPGVPPVSNEARGLLSSYQASAAELGEQLKKYAEATRSADPKGSLMLIRLQLIQEELAELAAAMREGDSVEALDALVDLSYVVDGTYITLGLHELKENGLIEVHRSNMSKLDEDGKPLISPAGRVMKSDRYSPPDLEGILDYFNG